MKKSNYLWLIDAGHGGLTQQGVYTTAPNKMFVFPDGMTIHEGVINRSIAKRLYEKALDYGVDFALVYDDVDDTDLHTRVNLVNSLQRKNWRCILLSIHSNAGQGRGFEVFTSPGFTKSDLVAEPLCDTLIRHFPQYPLRIDKADGDKDKEAKFTMLTQTICPAVLVENLFFDNRQEAEFLMSPEGQERIAKALFDWIIQIENTKPI